MPGAGRRRAHQAGREGGRESRHASLARRSAAARPGGSFSSSCPQPPGSWSRALNLLPRQASWSVTFTLLLRCDISIKPLAVRLALSQALPLPWAVWGTAPTPHPAGAPPHLWAGSRGPRSWGSWARTPDTAEHCRRQRGARHWCRGQGRARLRASLPLGGAGSHGALCVGGGVGQLERVVTMTGARHRCAWHCLALSVGQVSPPSRQPHWSALMVPSPTY